MQFLAYISEILFENSLHLLRELLATDLTVILNYKCLLGSCFVCDICKANWAFILENVKNTIFLSLAYEFFPRLYKRCSGNTRSWVMNCLFSYFYFSDTLSFVMKADRHLFLHIVIADINDILDES